MRTLELRPGRAAIGIVALVAVFLAGAVSGAALDRRLLLVSPDGWKTDGRPAAKEPSPEVRRALQTGIPTAMLRLNLTAEQEAALTEISKRRRPRADSVMLALRPVVSGLETQMMQEMLCALAPEQQTHWLAFMDTAKFSPDIVAERYRPVRDHTCDRVGK